jgi:predicted transcriptional regulator
MKGLDRRDIKILTRSFLERLNDEVNGDESRCVAATEIFRTIRLKAFGEVVIPAVVQELVYQGFIKECENKDQVRITRKGKQVVTRTIEANAYMILKGLVEERPDETGRVVAHGTRLQELTDLTPAEINDAISILEESGMVKAFRVIGTHPFSFYNVSLTARGRYEYERQRSADQESEVEERRISRPPAPVGSPFGFTDLDWEIVTERNDDGATIYVVFGFQFESDYYITENLKRNIENMFLKAIHEYSIKDKSFDVKLIFKTLAAGYGGHLFNEIARDIISSDISVFEVSDRNPNVMIEMGVALTWGNRVLPIRHKESPHPPADISGQTWAEYVDDGLKFSDPNHEAKLVYMVETAARKKKR